MKKSKWVLWLAALIPVLMLCGLALRAAADPYQRVTRRFEQDWGALAMTAQLVLAQESTEGIESPEGWEVAYYDRGVPTVEFEFGSWGMGSSTSYCGVNYVPADRPVGFQGSCTEGWKTEDEGFRWLEAEGDNCCYAERLAPCWYYYKMDF